MKFFQKIFIVTLLALLTACASSNQVERHWIDVRSAEEYHQQHLEGSVNIPHSQITAAISDITNNKNAEIYLYCRSGRRADLAKQALEAMGYTKVINLKTLSGAQTKMKTLD
jgi:phage shock protein E